MPAKSRLTDRCLMGIISVYWNTNLWQLTQIGLNGEH